MKRATWREIDTKKRSAIITESDGRWEQTWRSGSMRRESNKLSGLVHLHHRSRTLVPPHHHCYRSCSNWFTHSFALHGSNGKTLQPPAGLRICHKMKQLYSTVIIENFSLSGNLPPFVEPQRPFLCPQEPAIASYSEPQSAQILPHYFLKTYFNIILPSKSRFPKWPISFMFPLWRLRSSYRRILPVFHGWKTWSFTVEKEEACMIFEKQTRPTERNAGTRLYISVRKVRFQFQFNALA
jgi:hypothetical protein